MVRSRRVKGAGSARPESAPTQRRLRRGPWRPGNGGARAANGTWLCGFCAASRWMTWRMLAVAGLVIALGGHSKAAISGHLKTGHFG